MDLICGGVGFIAGVLTTNIVSRLKPKAGTLRIDHSNPEKDVYRFEIDDLDNLSKKKHIVLKVDNYADLSQN